MKRKRPIPGVDEAALAMLAGQFPSGSLRPAEPPVQDPVQDNVPLTLDDKEARALPSVAPAVGATLLQKAPGRGLVVGAMLLALIALLVAVTAVMPPPARVWLTRTFGDWPIVNLVTADRVDVDRRLAAASQSIDALAAKQSDVDARLKAIETAAASGVAMQRLEALDAQLAAIDQRFAAASESEGTSVARATALEARVATFDGELKTVEEQLAATDHEVNDVLAARLGAVEADVGALQKIDRRPEKFFMAALQLRDVTRTASPYPREIAAAQALAGDNPDLAAALKLLAGNAEHGVATVAELRDNFTTVIAPRLAAVAAAHRQPVAERAWDWVQSLFTTGAPAEATGERNAALVALAARSLAQGQLEAAVQQLLLLEDEAALVAAEWLKNASVRLGTDKAIATVMSQALEQLKASN